MAKTGYQTDYVVRNAGADLSDLLAVHQSVFPKNQLSLWRTAAKVIVKVSHTGQIPAKSLAAAKAEINYAEPKKDKLNAIG